MVMLLFAMNIAQCQDTPDGGKAQASPEQPYSHLFGAGFGFTFIPLASVQGETDANGLFVPAIGLDYFYSVHPKWAIGFMGALEIGHYSVTDQEIARDNAINLALLGMYRATSHLGVYMGGGIEMEQHQNLAVLRLGTVYTIDMGSHWALVPKLYVDFKKNYNTWSLAVTISRKIT
jgi:hypothetical protein